MRALRRAVKMLGPAALIVVTWQCQIHLTQAPKIRPMPILIGLSADYRPVVGKDASAV